MTTTASPPKRHASKLFHRHHSLRHRTARSPSPAAEPNDTSNSNNSDKPAVFEGTDTVAQNRKVAVQRIVEIHDALELRHHTETAARSAQPDSTTTTAATTADAVSVSSDAFTLDGAMDFAEAEVRAFRYFLRKWDPNAPPADPDFDRIVVQQQQQPSLSSKRRFEEEAVKHFMRRIAFWHESDEVMQAGRGDKRTKEGKKEKERDDSVLGKMWLHEKGRPEHGLRDGLKEISTREGLAQLLWTLLHDSREPLTPEFFAECTEAVKMKYGIKS